ncbi:rhodanese-like domain-containing protein [Desulfovibrio ferrophilus]|uniref:Molybdopterin synthase sulfurylase MoeB n=1 Tax=Desulfovibrio ferrophilus TaxID=241368 RepID=A0A2Z6AZ96_9BACT|nr:rhodanese-like domain-containing protein [Desulfovibrio ferrophilus]BBD08476.1 molybdopterin synthase sulfurylase MoeB [Desulfovibrio ferrophilus]
MKRIMTILLTLTLCTCLAQTALPQDLTKKDLVREAKAAVTHVDVNQAKLMWDKGGVYFIDCREDKEFRQGHIAGALTIPRGWLEFKIEELVPERDASIVLYCRSGDRSSLGVLSLLRMGYGRTVNLIGGWRAWNKAEYPVE